MRRQLPVRRLELDFAIRQALAEAQNPRDDGDRCAVSFGTGRKKLVCSCTVVIGLNSPSWAIIASSIAVSAAARIACPQSTPPPWTSSGVTGRRERDFPRGGRLDAQASRFV